MQGCGARLVPQVFGWAADVSVEVGHVDELRDAGLSGCLGNLLRDAHEDILIAEVPLGVGRGKKTYSHEECLLTMFRLMQPSSCMHLQLRHPEVTTITYYCSNCALTYLEVTGFPPTV